MLAEITKKLDELGERYSVLLISSPNEIHSTILDAVEYLAGKGIPGLLISFNKPCDVAMKQLHDRGVNTDKIFFVDCVTSIAHLARRSDNVLYLNNPANLTGLGIGITQFLEAIQGEKFLLIDTLRTLSIYVDQNTIASFVRSLAEKSSRYELRTVVITTESEKHELEDKITPFFDTVIKVKPRC